MKKEMIAQCKTNFFSIFEKKRSTLPDKFFYMLKKMVVPYQLR